MSNSYFQFKYFTVWHDRCAMKVGTDGVLLGAWIPYGSYQCALDVGAGTGLISLQLAQRMPDVRITAVEIDAEAAQQARENVLRSPWGDRIEVVCQDFGGFEPAEKYDLIVSNPPFFVDALKCPDRHRSLARHTVGRLNYDSLLRRASSLLRPEGKVCLIVPFGQEKSVEDIGWLHKLYPSRRVRVYTKAGKPCKRVLLQLEFRFGQCVEETLCLMEPDGSFTQAYKDLVEPFYLKM